VGTERTSGLRLGMKHRVIATLWLIPRSSVFFSFSSKLFLFLVSIVFYTFRIQRSDRLNNKALIGRCKGYVSRPTANFPVVISLLDS